MALQPLVAALVIALAVVAGACGADSPSGEPSAQPQAVTGVLDAQRGQSGPPDAGTAGGHAADRYVARAEGPTVRITGRVRPVTAAVQVRDRAGRRLARGIVAGDGGFTAILPDVSVGTTIFALTATVDGLRPWTAEIAVTRARRPRRTAADRGAPRAARHAGARTGTMRSGDAIISSGDRA